MLVEDIDPGSPGASPRYLTNVNGTLYFSAYDDRHGRELWALKPSPFAAGDANRDFAFDQLDIIQVLHSARFLIGETATWEEEDWNEDGVFGQEDIEEALQTGSYQQGPYVDEVRREPTE